MGRMSEREELKDYYPDSESWKVKVDFMSDKQVIAVLLRFRNQKQTHRKAA